MIACFQTVDQTFPEESDDQIKLKFQSLNKLVKICDKLKIDKDMLDLTNFYELRDDLS